MMRSIAVSERLDEAARLAAEHSTRRSARKNHSRIPAPIRSLIAFIIAIIMIGWTLFLIGFFARIATYLVLGGWESLD